MNRPTLVRVLAIAAAFGAGVGTTLLTQSLAAQNRTPTASGELGAFEEQLSAGDYQAAYDALLAAMRVAPGDEKVFDATVRFVRAAARDPSDEAVALAQEMHQRAANLLPFLPLAGLQQARVLHTRLGDELFAPKQPTHLEDPLAEAQALLQAARQPHPPLSARTRLLHEVEAELAGQARRVATIPTKSPEQERFWKHWQGVKEDYELVQREVLAALYDADCKPRLAAWRQKAHACLSQPADTELAEAYRANEAILALISEGQRVSRDLTPYVEGGVAAAVKDHDEDGPPKLLTRLAQLREWNYNRSALDWIDRTERSTGTALDKLTSLAKIDESRLAPYVGQRLAEVWKKLFEDCSKEDKVEATKRRILREYQ